MTFDAIEARETEQFFANLTLTKSTRSGGPEPFQLLPHGKKIVLNALCWKREDGRRQYRRVFASMGRKQAKTQNIAGLAVHELFRSKEMQPEIYMAAKDRDQASICFDAAKSLIQGNDYLASLCQITASRKEIRCRHNGGIMRALSSEGAGKHGYNPSLVIIDEFHTWGAPEKELYDALTTGSKTRREPLVVIITTAGSDKETLCGKEYEYAKRILSGDVEDPSYLPIIYEVPPDGTVLPDGTVSDWTNRDLWHLAMPALGMLCSLDDFDEEFRQAIERPEEQNKFRRLYLNQWTSSETQWIPIEKWDACAVKPEDQITEDLLRSLPCWAGLDLGSTRDLTGLALCWPLPDGRMYLRVWGYIPGDDIHGRSRRDNVRYDLWAANGHILTTPGAVTDWRFAAAHVIRLRDEGYQLQAVAFDRWGARDTAREIEEASIPVVDFGQGYASMSPAVKRMEGLVFSGNLIHETSPAMRWCVDCSSTHEDPAGNKKIVKPPTNKNTRRVDLAQASVMAVGISVSCESVQDPYANGASAVFV